MSQDTSPNTNLIKTGGGGGSKRWQGLILFFKLVFGELSQPTVINYERLVWCDGVSSLTVLCYTDLGHLYKEIRLYFDGIVVKLFIESPSVRVVQNG